MNAFTAVAEPHRRLILDRLRDGECGVTELVDLLRMSQPGVSKHLRILREAGLLEAVPRGREMMYRLARRPGGLTEARLYFERVSRAWDRALDAFKAFAEQEDER